MRIAAISLHTCPLAALGGKETGGMNVYVRELSRQLGMNGIMVDVFTRSQNPDLPRVVSMGPGSRVIHIPAGAERPLDKHRLSRHIPEFLNGMIRFAEQEGISYDLVHSHYWLSGWIGALLKPLWGIPWVHMYHTLGFLNNHVARPGEVKEPSIRLTMEAKIGKEAERVVVPTPMEKAHLIWSLGIAPEKIRVIPCGVDVELFQPVDPHKARNLLGLDSGRFILFVGRLTPVKGLDTLIRAFRILADRGWNNGKGVRLLIVGGDQEEPDADSSELSSLAGSLGVADKMLFLGPQRQSLLPLFYASAEVCVLPSRYESFGMVALEAMACGKPVVASNVGGLAFSVLNDETGVLVPEGDPSALAVHLSFLLDHPEVARTLGRRAAQRALNFRWPLIADRMLDLYHQLTPSRKPATAPQQKAQEIPKSDPQRSISNRPRYYYR
ncbi:MAG: glycosyltransferase [Deltaproteobacteria bacterium]|nr:glycosyltransferase [Deltaproteobacteria bacterium]